MLGLNDTPNIILNSDLGWTSILLNKINHVSGMMLSQEYEYLEGGVSLFNEWVC